MLFFYGGKVRSTIIRGYACNLVYHAFGNTYMISYIRNIATKYLGSYRQKFGYEKIKWGDQNYPASTAITQFDLIVIPDAFW